MQETYPTENSPFYADFWKNSGDSLTSWFLLAIIPLILLLIINRKGRSRTMSHIASSGVSVVWILILLGFHWFMSFGEDFTEGIDDCRARNWSLLTTLTVAIFTILNAKKPPLHNKIE